jgi:hypothetical protein
MHLLVKIINNKQWVNFTVILAPNTHDWFTQIDVSKSQVCTELH